MMTNTAKVLRWIGRVAWALTGIGAVLMVVRYWLDHSPGGQLPVDPGSVDYKPLPTEQDLTEAERAQRILDRMQGG